MEQQTNGSVRELRRDPVSGGWVVVATDLARQPGLFLRDGVETGECRLCPGHERATPHEVLAFRDSGGANEPGWRVRVIPEFSPVLRVETPMESEAHGPYDRMNGVGAHELVVESPEHGRSLADLPEWRVTEVLAAIRERFTDLRRDQRLRYIAAFRNHGKWGGEFAGSTGGHGYWQMIGLPVIPKRVAGELVNARKYFDLRERCVVCDLVKTERAQAARVVAQDDRCMVVTPYASRVPFETWVVPLEHGSHFEQASREALDAAARGLRDALRRLDAVLDGPAYNVTLQSAPVQEPLLPHFHWRLEIVPRITAAAASGFEWGTQAHVNPTAPEEAARYLREALLD